MTLELVVEEDKTTKTYEAQIPNFYGFQLHETFDQFHLSKRGQIGTETYDGKGLIQKIRIFAKRSENNPESTLPIDVAFSVPDTGNLSVVINRSN